MRIAIRSAFALALAWLLAPVAGAQPSPTAKVPSGTQPGLYLNVWAEEIGEEAAGDYSASSAGGHRRASSVAEPLASTPEVPAKLRDPGDDGAIHLLAYLVF